MIWSAEVVVARLDCLESHDEAQISHYLRTALDTAEKVEERKESMLKELAEEILRGAASMTVPNRKLFRAFDIITSSGHYADDQLKCHEVLEIIVNFEDFDKVPCLSAILTFLSGYLPNVNCSHFDDQEDCSTFVTNLLGLFKWFWTVFEQVMKNEFFGDKLIDSVGLQALKTANEYLEDVFIMKTLQLVAQKKIQGGIGTTFQGQRKLAKLAKSPALLNEFELLQKNIERIHGEMEKLPLHYFNTIGALQKRPGIRSLTSIFMSFRVLTPALEIAETIELIGTINNYGRSQVAVDILHACLLILLEEFPLQAFPPQITNDEKKLDVYKLNLISIFFKKFPQIFEILVNRGYLAWTDVLFAVDHLIRTFKQELDLLDYAFRSNSIRLFLETFVERKVMSKETFEKAIQIRNDQIKTNTDLNAFLIRSEEKAQLPPFALNNKRIYDHLIRNYISSTSLESNLKNLYAMNIVWQDGVCAWHCVEGDILELTHRLASLMYGHEKAFMQQEQNSQESLDLFGLHFVLLSRISWFFSSLTLEELVTGPNGTEDNLESAYYKWAKSHVKRIIPKEEEFQEGINSSMNELSIESKKEELMEPKEEIMETEQEAVDSKEFMVKSEPLSTFTEETRAECLNLAHRQIFWNKERTSPKDLLALVPTIGEVWLNEYKTRHPERSTVRDLIQSLKDVPVMILCLCQWLENQPYSLARFQLGEAVLESVEEQIKSIEQQIKSNRDKVPDAVKQWTLLWVQCRLHLREISEHPPVFHPMSVFQKSVANRTLPKCEKYEIPLANQMKDMWIYCQRQNWFSVRTLVLIDHLNKSNNQRSWITGLSYSTIKSETQDSVAKSIEMITTIILLDPVKAAAKAIEVLTDLLLMRDPTKNPEKPTIMQVPECTMPIVQATIQSLIIGVWLVNRRNETKEPFDKKRRRSSIEVEQPWKSLMNDDADELDVLNAFISNAINCLVSEALSGVMRPASSVIYHVLNFIARSEKNRFRDMLIKRIPQNMIFRLAVVDPYSLPLEVFSEFCEDQQAHNESQLQYLFLLRKCGGI